MPIIGTGLSTPGIRAEFFQRFDEVHKQTYWDQLATRLASKTKTEDYTFLGQVPPMREWGTGRLARGVFVEKYSVADLKYEITLEVDREEIEDDQLGQIRIRINEMASRAAQHKDVLIGDLLKNGASAGFLSYDGQIFFSNAHVSGLSGTQDNTLAESGTADKDNPTTAEWRVALRNAIARLLTFKDDQGEIMSMGATGLVAVVPPNMFVTAAESLNATLVASTTNVLAGAARIVVFPYLTATDTWYLLKTDVAVRPFILQDRIPLEFTALEQNSDEGFRRDKFLYGVRARYRMTYGYWQYALKITFAV